MKSVRLSCIVARVLLAAVVAVNAGAVKSGTVPGVGLVQAGSMVVLVAAIASAASVVVVVTLVAGALVTAVHRPVGHEHPFRVNWYG